MHAAASDLCLLLGRIALAAIFIPAGFSKLANLAGFSAGLDKRGVPFAELLAPLGAGIEFFGGIAVAAGVYTRPAALLMLLFTVVATLIGHRFWEFAESARQAQQTQFMKNLAIAGGYLVLAAAGGGRHCIDRLWRRQRYPQTPT